MPALVGAGFALLVMCVGVVLTSRWAPPSMEPIAGDPLTIMRYGRSHDDTSDGLRIATVSTDGGRRVAVTADYVSLRTQD